MMSTLAAIAIILATPGSVAPEQIPDELAFRESREISGEFIGRSIVVERGVRLTLVGDARFEALETLDVLGEILGGPTSDGEGASLELVAGEGIRVLGSVAAGDGGMGHQPGEPGGRGGDVKLVSPLLLCRDRAPSAGAGGRGGPGGPGGQGGHLHVTAVAVDLEGTPLTIVGSRGGDGGPGQVGMPAASGGAGGAATAGTPDEQAQQTAHELFRRWTGRSLVPQRETNPRAPEALTPATANP